MALYGTLSASSKKEVSLKPERELGYVTLNCMGRAIPQFDKEASPRLGTGVEYIAWNCMELYGTRLQPVRKTSWF